MDSLGEALKIFLNKHLIATILSIVISFLFNLVLPNDYWMITKLGINAFRIFVFCICFIFIQLIIWIIKKIKKLFLHYTLKKEHQKYEKCKIKNNIRNWRNAADKMTPQDRDAICKLLKNNNTPIPSSDFSIFDFYSIYNTQYVHKSKNSDGIEMVKLTHECYEIFSYIYEEYGMIGNFK